MRFQCINTVCSPPTVVFASNLRDCQYVCLANEECRTASFHQSINHCELFTETLGQYGILLEALDTITLTAVDERQTSPRVTYNWVINGDAELESCTLDGNAKPPKYWNYSGEASRISYVNPYGSVGYNHPGPSDRGKCYFHGWYTSFSSMWQTVNMTRTIDPSLIDNQTVSFNISAWIGGYLEQDDNAAVSLTFLDQINQPIGNNTTLGPVLAADRGNISSLLFRQASGLVPVGSRSFKVTVTMTRLVGTSNDGSVDNIAVNLYQ